MPHGRTSVLIELVWEEMAGREGFRVIWRGLCHNALVMGLNMRQDWVPQNYLKDPGLKLASGCITETGRGHHADKSTPLPVMAVFPR